MDVLADENVTSEWVQALVDDGYDVLRVADLGELGAGAPDARVLTAATNRDRVLLTADQADFSDPPTDEHAGVLVVTDITRTGGEVWRAVGRIDETVPDLSGEVVYLSDWL